MKVQAIVVRARGGEPRIESLDVREPAPDEILVRLLACGVARADIDATSGELPMALPFVPGSEGAGLVEKVGRDVNDLAPGDAVLLEPARCGTCEACRGGRYFACAAFTALNLSGHQAAEAPSFEAEGGEIHGAFFGQSSFATHALCAARHAYRLDANAPLEILAALGQEVVRGASVVFNGFRLQSGDTLVVLGADALGLAAVMAAKSLGAGLVLVADRDERRREIASAVGADLTAHGIEHLAELVESVEASGADFALDTIGDDASRVACRESVVSGGTCAFVAPPPDASMGAANQRPNEGCLLLAADDCCTHGVRERLLRLYRDGAFPLEKIIDFFPFERAGDAMAALRRGDAAKPVLRFPLGPYDALDRAQTEGAAEALETDEAPDVDEDLEPARPPLDALKPV